MTPPPKTRLLIEFQSTASAPDAIVKQSGLENTSQAQSSLSLRTPLDSAVQQWPSGLLGLLRVTFSVGLLWSGKVTATLQHERVSLSSIACLDGGLADQLSQAL